MIESKLLEDIIRLNKMYFSRKGKLIFNHIHKTGGNSLIEIFSIVFDDFCKIPFIESDHCDLNTLIQKFYIEDINLDKYKIFTVLRNPLDHVVSIYHYWNQTNKKDPKSKLPWVKSAIDNSFDDFVLLTINKSSFKGYEENLKFQGILPYNNYISRLENIEIDLPNFLLENYNYILKVKIPVLNKSKHKYFKYYIKDNLEKIIKDKYKLVYDIGFYS